MFTVDREVQISIPISPWVSKRIRAAPGKEYDAFFEEEGGLMAKFRITFVDPGATDEDVEANEIADHDPFVDFNKVTGGGGVRHTEFVARYRAKDIKRILRVEG